MNAFSRILYFFPIVHTQADMGQFGDSVRRAAIRQLGIKAWRHKKQAIDEMWTKIEKTIDRLPLPYDKVRLYQDGLPVCEREEEIVRELAEKGSRNHRLLVRLMNRGASLMGTESPELLTIEYQLLKDSVESRSRSPQNTGETRAPDPGSTLLDRRNRFIAKRIDSTLQAGEIGILFLGMLHTLEDFLDEDIQVIYPISRPYQPGGRNHG